MDNGLTGNFLPSSLKPAAVKPTVPPKPKLHTDVTGQNILFPDVTRPNILFPDVTRPAILFPDVTGPTIPPKPKLRRIVHNRLSDQSAAYVGSQYIPPKEPNPNPASTYYSSLPNLLRAPSGAVVANAAVTSAAVASAAVASTESDGSNDGEGRHSYCEFDPQN